MFTIRAGLPDKSDGGGDKPVVDNWEGRTGSEASAKYKEEEEEDTQDFD